MSNVFVPVESSFYKILLDFHQMFGILLNTLKCTMQLKITGLILSIYGMEIIECNWIRIVNV